MPTTRVILENVFGMLGIFFWSFQLLPQVIDNYRAKSTQGLSSSMFILWTLAALGFGSYGIIEGLSIPIIVQPHIFGFFSTICFLQCFYYGQGPAAGTKGSSTGSENELEEEGASSTKDEKAVRERNVPLRTILVVATVLFLVLGGVEVGAYFGTIAGKDQNVPGTIEAAGIIPVVLLTVGFFPQYVDILRHRSVVGVSMVFIAGDASGSVFSIISLALRDKFDLLAAMNYILVLVCDLVVVGFYVYYNRMHPALARVP
ncbi:MAG: PQ loop repeat-domain-containing protein [Linnemannia gamsii]|nr:MAG: PQ loop repeat-domain-containing protein [Linnemannia gamsii]